MSEKKPNSPKKSATSQPGDRVVEASFLAGATGIELFPPPVLAEVAFAGRSNVGKSSLLNALTGRKGLVRTSGTPGCTRQVAWFRTVSDDKAVIDLVDLPGYGYAKRSKSERKEWAGLIENYLMERPTLRGVLVLVDIRRGLEPDDAELLEMLADDARVSRKPLEVTIVATKLDKLSPSKQKPALAKLKKEIGRPVLGFSSVTGAGRVPLWRRIRRIAQVGVEAEEVEGATPEGSSDAVPADIAPPATADTRPE